MFCASPLQFLKFEINYQEFNFTEITAKSYIEYYLTKV